MKKLNSTIVAAAIFGLLAIPMAAQAQAGGGNRGGGQRMGMGGQMAVSKLMLLNRNDVKKDLKTTDEQNKAIEKIQADMMEKMRTQFQSGGQGGERPDMAKIREEMEKMNKEADEAVAKILDAKQLARLGQIRIQINGNRSLLDADVQKQLGIKADQKKKFDDLMAQQQAANATIMQRVRDGELTREELAPLFEQNNKALDTELEKVLTAEQKTAFNAMKGEKFARDPKDDEAMRGFGMGRGGRGGN